MPTQSRHQKSAPENGSAFFRLASSTATTCCARNRPELIAQTHGIVATAHGKLRAMLASDQGDTIGPSEYS